MNGFIASGLIGLSCLVVGMIIVWLSPDEHGRRRPPWK